MPRPPKVDRRKRPGPREEALPAEWLAPPDDMPPPPVETLAGVLPLHDLTWLNFERLLVAIALNVFSWRDARRYGTPGQAQHGLDVIAYSREGEPRALQGKDVIQFGKSDLKKAVDKFAKGRRPFECRWLAIAVACSIERTQALEELHRLRQQYSDLEIDLWDEQRLSTMLRGHPHLVRQFFGETWERLFCGPTSAASSVSTPRGETLGALLTNSRARLITRWLAAGVDEADAEAFASDPTMGSQAKLQAVLPSTGFVCVEGEFGSGKSVFVERIHQLDVVDTRKDLHAPVPVHLMARELRDPLEVAILTETRLLGNPRHLGVRVILDGLDEPGLDVANSLIEQARRLVRSWPRTRIIATARPGLDLRSQERVAMPLLDEEERKALLTRVAGSPYFESVWPAPVREAIQRPLFLLIAISLHRHALQHPLPRSRAAFLDAFAKTALGRNARLATEARAGLLRLASLTLSAGGSVPAGEFGTAEAQEVLLGTRLVIRRGRALAFALPIIEQYFGGQSLLEGLIQLKTVLESPDALERWRYALVLAIGLGSWEQVSTLMEQLAVRHPGMAAWLVPEAVSEYPAGNEELPPLPSSIECARRLHRTLATWLTAFEPISGLTTLARTDGTPQSVAAHSKGAHLTAAICLGDEAPPRVDAIEIPEEVHPFRGGDISDQWILFRLAQVPSDEAAWPWRWSLKWMNTVFKRLLEAKALPAPPGSPAQRELRWALAKKLLDRENDIFHQPLPALEVKRAVERLIEDLRHSSEEPALQLGDVHVYTTELRQFAADLDSGREGDTNGMLRRPWLMPDQPGALRHYVWDIYSNNVLRALTEQVYQAALDIYIELINAWFPKLRDALQLSSALPFRLEGMMEPPSRDDSPDGPGLVYCLQPLPPGASTTAAVTLARTDSMLTDYRRSLEARLEIEYEKRRVDFLRWHSASSTGLRLSAFMSYTDTTLFIFEDMPATDLAYEWLRKDLTRLRLLD